MYFLFNGTDIYRKFSLYLYGDLTTLLITLVTLLTYYLFSFYYERGLTHVYLIILQDYSSIGWTTYLITVDYS